MSINRNSTKIEVDKWVSDGPKRLVQLISEEGLVDIEFAELKPNDRFMCYDGEELVEATDGQKEFIATSFPYLSLGILCIKVSPQW